MTAGNKSYVKPTELINVLVDDYGNKVEVGDERDIGEFNEIMIGRVIDAMNAQQDKLAGQDLTPNPDRPVAVQIEKNAITELLHGKQIIVSSYEDARTGQLHTKKESDNFFHYQLHVQKFDSLLKAWENQHFDTVKFEYKKGEPLVDRQIRTWVDELPKVFAL